MTLAQLILAPIGLATLLLGIAHFFFPILLDFRHAIPREGPPLTPLSLGPLRYGTLRSDVHGIAWVMNHAASYVLVSIGLVDLIAAGWLVSDAGRPVALWIAGWWFLRAGSQLYLGRRRADWLILAAFAVFGVVHLLIALAPEASVIQAAGSP
jgi:hypothetical protein